MNTSLILSKIDITRLLRDIFPEIKLVGANCMSALFLNVAKIGAITNQEDFVKFMAFITILKMILQQGKLEFFLVDNNWTCFWNGRILEAGEVSKRLNSYLHATT